jgi:peptide deformylase
MQILEVNKIPLTEQIIDVSFDNLIKVLKLFQDLQILCEKEKGIGISAVQAGIPLRLFLIKGDGTCPLVEKDKYACFLNCKYESIDDERLMSLERCLSIRSPDGRLRFFQVERHKNIKLYGYRLDLLNGLNIKEVNESIGVHQQGVVFQHEIDHQNGLLISDIGKEIFIW